MDKLSDIQRKILLDTLLLFHDLCQKLGLSYCLAYGTLLGAVRHGGFIPWDDDIDIMIKRDDYEKLLAYCRQHKNEDWCLGCFDCGTKNIHLLSKFYNRKYRVLEEGNFLTCPWLDIFVLDPVPKEKFSSYLKKVKFSASLWSAKKEKIRFDKHYTPTKFAFCRILDRVKKILCPISEERAEKMLLSSLTKYKDCPNADMFFCWTTDKNFSPKNCVFEKDWFEESIEWDFEGHKIMIPKEYDRLLTKMFGDYMTPPPPEKRVFQHQNIFLRPGEHYVCLYRYPEDIK